MKKIIVLSLLSFCAGTLFAQNDSLNYQLTRAAAAATQEQDAKVTLHFKWEKPVRSSDVMFRTPRGEDVILRWDHAKTTCTGVVSNENRIYFVADCLEPSSFELEHLKEVQVTLPNGVLVSGGKTNIGRYNDTAWLLVTQTALEGAPALSVRHTPKGKSLQDAYGASMANKLKSWFRSKHIPARSHSCRIGYQPSTPQVEVGDPVIIGPGETRSVFLPRFLGRRI